MADLDEAPSTLPCSGVPGAWELYVRAAMRKSPWTDGELGAPPVPLRVSPRLAEALAAKHADPHEAWPSDLEVQKAVLRRTTFLKRRAQPNARERDEADAACRFVRSIGLKLATCG